MNLWILNHYCKPGQRHDYLARELLQKGHNVKLFVASSYHHSNKNLITDSSKYVYKDVNKVPFIFVRTSNYNSGLKRVKSMVEFAYRLLSVSKNFDEERPEVILASSVHPLTWISGYLLAKRYNAQFIAETRDLWPETFVAMGKMKRNSILAKVLYKLEYFIYKRADKLIFTFAGGKDYVSELGLDASKVYYINNGVDNEEFNLSIINNKYIDEDLEDKNTFKILYTGSMGISNNLMALIKAAERINQLKLNNIKFILFGSGYERDSLEKYANEKGLSNVIFKGSVEQKYIPYILSKSNLNIILSKDIYLYRYGISLNKLFSYLASGKPILSNINCGYNILDKYKCGKTVDGKSNDSLVEGILGFYNMDINEHNIYSNNALIAAKDYDFKKLAIDLEKVLIN